MTGQSTFVFFLVCLAAIHSRFSLAKEPETQSDVPYATVQEIDLKLDFYPSEKEGISPLIVWVHGGAWRRGNKSSVPIKGLTEAGFSIASLDYRLRGTAR